MNNVKFTDEEITNVIQLYEDGKSSVAIGKNYGVGHKVILKLLHEYGVTVDGNKSRRHYRLNEHYFDVIDTPFKAYSLGLLFADGSVQKKKGTVSIALEEQDSYILERIRKEVQSEKPLEYIDYTQKHDNGYTYSNQYRLLFFSMYMCKSLESKGMLENKSWNLSFPEWIDSDLLRHFVRGYFDGNGSYCPHVTKSGKFQPLITITSTKDFCVRLREKIQEELSIPCGNVYDASCHNGTTKVLSFSGRNQVKKFLDWIYEDSDVYLVRKYQKYTSSFYNIDNSLMA